MNKKRLIVGTALLCVVILGIFFAFTFIGNDYSVPRLPALYPSHEVRHFKFIDQRGRIITEDSVAGKVFIANFFFTSCKDVCVSMNRNVKKIYDALHQYPDFIILSHTVNPSTDSVPVLAKYAKQWNADPNQWLFLTGPKKELFKMARFTYMLTTFDRKNSGTDADSSDFVHTQMLALVGRRGRIRGIFNSLKSSDIKKCIQDAKILLREDPK